MRRKSALLSILGILLFFSCKHDEVYFKYRVLPEARWEKEQALSFLLDSLDVLPTRRYDIWLEITNRSAYPYKKLWLYIDQNITDSVFTTDTVEVELADDLGRWQGAHVGTLYQISHKYISLAELDTAKTYLLRVRQAMQDYRINGIERVGVRVR